MRKYLGFLFVLVLVLSLSVLPTGAAQAEKGEDLEAGTIVVTNGIYTLSVQDQLGGVGTYTVATGSTHPNPNQNILYNGAVQSPGTTYLTVRVYETLKEYVSTSGGPTPSAGYTVVALDTRNPSVTQLGNAVRTTWTTPENLAIEQVTAVEGTVLAGSRVRVTTTITNNSATPYDVGIRYEWDLMIDGSDDSWFAERNPDAAWTETETAYAPPIFERFETVNDPSTPIFSVYGTVNGPAVFVPPPTPPDRVVYASWVDSFSSAFDYTPTGQSGMDSAVLYYWGIPGGGTPITLAASGGSTSVTQYLYAIPPENVPPATDPVTVTNLTSPTPTISWSYFDPEGAPQDQYEVEVWTGVGGTGTRMWNPAVGSGTGTSITYAGDTLTVGQTYCVRVKASDGTNWGDWSETSCVLSTPSAAPVGGTVYPINKAGILAPWLSLALIFAAGGALLVMRRRKTVYS